MIRVLIAAAALTAATTAQAAETTFYQLPQGAFPHDVAPAADGSVWYTGQRKGFLGRFDPKTQKNEEIPLGAERRPARRRRRPRRRGLGHRRRPERDRARRCRHQSA